MHHCHNPNSIDLFHVNDGVRKFCAEVSAHGRIEFPKALRMRAYILDESFHFPKETDTKVRSDLSVVAHGFSQLGVRFGMKHVPHSPAILRMRARDSSTGMPSTLPLSISLMR